MAYSNIRNLQENCLSVTIIHGLTPIERARLFTIVNRQQTKVPSYLLWDLYALIDPDGIRGKISIFVQKLNERGPFKDLIKLPRVRSVNAYLSFTNMCASVFKRTGLYKNYGNQNSFFNVVRSFFEVIQDDVVLGEDWARSKEKKGRKGFVCTNNAITIQLYLLSMILNYRDENGIVFPTQENVQNEWKEFFREKVVGHFIEFLNQHLDQENPEDPFGSLRKKTSNEGARRDATKFIFDRIEF